MKRGEVIRLWRMKGLKEERVLMFIKRIERVLRFVWF